jgi:hypothetical protein
MLVRLSSEPLFMHFFFITTGKTAVAILFATVLPFITNSQLVRSTVRPSTVSLIGVLDEKIERFRLGLWPCRELGSHRHEFVVIRVRRKLPSTIACCVHNSFGPFPGLCCVNPLCCRCAMVTENKLNSV